MNAMLMRWNALDETVAAQEILPCCGSHAWALQLAAARPFAATEQLFRESDEVWRRLPATAWREAFDSHPRIGEQHAAGATTEQALAWSAEEQAASARERAPQVALIEANRRYEEKFGRTFIVCALGKDAAVILNSLEARMNNDAGAELYETAEQQRQITQLRLRRWLGDK